MELRPPTLLVTCVAGLISGAASMAADEYISIKSQQDIEKNALDMEARELKCHPEPELQKLKNFYIQRGLQHALAEKVTKQLTAHNALDAHTRDEIGISNRTLARPLLAAASSVGSLFPLIAIIVLSESYLDKGIMVVGIISLGLMVVLASYVGGVCIWRGSVRVMIWGIIAMLVSSLGRFII